MASRTATRTFRSGGTNIALPTDAQEADRPARRECRPSHTLSPPSSALGNDEFVAWGCASDSVVEAFHVVVSKWGALPPRPEEAQVPAGPRGAKRKAPSPGP